MSAEELSDAPSELSAAHSEAPLDPIECDDHTMLENRTLLPLEKIVSEIPNTVILTNFRIIRTRQINPGWRLQLSGTTLPLLSSDVWLKDVFAVKVCRTSYPQSIMVACVLMVGLSVLGTDYAQVKITDEATVGLSIAQFGVYVIALVLGVFGQCIRLPALSIRAFGFEDPNGMTKIPMLPIHADMIQTFAESVRKVQFQMGVHKCPHIPHDRILGQTMIDKVQATRWYKARAARKEQGTELKTELIDDWAAQMQPDQDPDTSNILSPSPLRLDGSLEDGPRAVFGVSPRSLLTMSPASNCMTNSEINNFETCSDKSAMTDMEFLTDDEMQFELDNA